MGLLWCAFYNPVVWVEGFLGLIVFANWYFNDWPIALLCSVSGIVVGSLGNSYRCYRRAYRSITRHPTELDERVAKLWEKQETCAHAGYLAALRVLVSQLKK